MAFIDQANLAADVTHRARVKVAMVTAATQIMGEAKGANSDSVWRKRQGLAYRVLQDPDAMVVLFAWSVSSDATIVTASTDAAIQNTVNAIWNDLAGVFSGE